MILWGEYGFLIRSFDRNLQFVGQKCKALLVVRHPLIETESLESLDQRAFPARCHLSSWQLLGDASMQLTGQEASTDQQPSRHYAICFNYCRGDVRIFKGRATPKGSMCQRQFLPIAQRINMRIFASPVNSKTKYDCGTFGGQNVGLNYAWRTQSIWFLTILGKWFICLSK